MDDDEDEEEVKVCHQVPILFPQYSSNNPLQTIKKQSEMLFVRGRNAGHVTDIAMILTDKQGTPLC